MPSPSGLTPRQIKPNLFGTHAFPPVEKSPSDDTVEGVKANRHVFDKPDSADGGSRQTNRSSLEKYLVRL